MDDDLHTLEAELQRLRPRPVTPACLARVESALPAARVPVRTWHWTLAWAAGLALLVTIGAVRQRSAAPVAPVSPVPAAPSLAAGPDGYAPVAAERTIYAAADEGPVTLADGTAARQVRHHFVDTIVWRDATTQTSLRWTVPGEEVRLVPVSFH